MLANIIYLAVFIILAFVLSIAVKAITRGVEAKQIIKEERDLEINNDNQKQNLEVVSQLKELKSLYDNGIINENEFKKAKEFCSTWGSTLVSLASSNKAKEYLLADMSENPLFLLNLLPLKMFMINFKSRIN